MRGDGERGDGEHGDRSERDGERGELPRRAGSAAATIPPARAAALAWVRGLETLEEILRRGLELDGVVVQDEYTHDVVTRTGEVFVVFDTT